MNIYPKRKRNRLLDFDYSESRFYFITICTKNRENYFGNIIEDKMVLSEIGKIADRCWRETPMHYHEIILDEYILMPNHLHGILYINDSKRKRNRHACSLHDRNKRKLPVVIGSFKSAVKKIANKIQEEKYFLWQKSYYDRIIRNKGELKEIRKYIQNNPLNWDFDEENPENIK